VVPGDGEGARPTRLGPVGRLEAHTDGHSMYNDGYGSASCPSV